MPLGFVVRREVSGYLMVAAIPPPSSPPPATASFLRLRLNRTPHLYTRYSTHTNSQQINAANKIAYESFNGNNEQWRRYDDLNGSGLSETKLAFELTNDQIDYDVSVLSNVNLSLFSYFENSITMNRESKRVQFVLDEGVDNTVVLYGIRIDLETKTMIV
ncbi:hypothetical protein M0802_003711 [Mischocyttarus mexicanus]|nr:hypothetical protein M0802_003711 [Mischocyttarus mexicanus]